MQTVSKVKADENVLRNTLLILGIVLVAFNLRPSITAVGPLINAIRTDTGISNSLAGLLTTLPLVAFAALAPLTPKIARKFGMERTVLFALIILAAGIFIRSNGMIHSLFIGTAVIGLGIAILNVILPGIVKQNFPSKVGLMTGMYTVSMALWAGIAPGISVPLALNMGWKNSLAVWNVLVVFGLIFWIILVSRQQRSVTAAVVPSISSYSLWKSSIAWNVTLFMGLQSMIYFCFVTWLPEMLYGNGISVTTAGLLVSLLQFSGLPGNFIIPLLADRLPHQKGLAIIIGAFCLLGIIGVFIGENIILLSVSIAFIGISTGAAISLALTLMGLRSRSSEQAANLSGMSQSIGYLLAALGPITLGILFDLFHTWTIPLIILGVLTLIMTLSGIAAGRNEYVTPEK